MSQKPIFRTATVLFKDRPAGVLSELSSGGSVFTYDPVYLTGASEPVGISLPLNIHAHSWMNELHPFFQHLGPEGGLRQTQARNASLDFDDDFGLLLAYGADCIGAISIVNPSATPPLSPRAPIESGNAADVLGSRTISGVQPKYLAKGGNNSVLPAGMHEAATLIVKLPDERLDQLVTNEDLSLRITRLLLGDAEVTEARREFVPGVTGLALVVRRFDRAQAGRKLRMEEFAQILAKPRGQRDTGKYDSSYEECAALIEQHSARPQVDLARFFRRLVAYVVVGNCDAHLKNFALVETPGGMRLSPAYDVVNAYYYAGQGYSTRFGLAMNGDYQQWEKVDRAALERFANAIGLRPGFVKQAFRDFESQGTRLFDLVGKHNPLVGELEKIRYEDVVRSAWLRLFPG